MRQLSSVSRPISREEPSMALRIALLTGCVLAFTPALAAELIQAAPVRIGVTTILSGQYADRSSSHRLPIKH
jgi:hypothetical protein